MRESGRGSAAPPSAAPPSVDRAAPLDDATVGRVARLARLGLSAQERGPLTRDLRRILEGFALLSSVPTDEVQPLVHPGADTTPLRPDDCAPGLDGAALAAAAPLMANGSFVVPRVVG